MVIDTSAILAILLGEPETEVYVKYIRSNTPWQLSAVSHVECSMVMATRKGDPGLRELDLFIVRALIAIVPFDADQAVFARHAFMTYGKGRHPAKLNFGDCCAYALAKALNEPLLFKGGDFALTDITAAL